MTAGVDTLGDGGTFGDGITLGDGVTLGDGASSVISLSLSSVRSWGGSTCSLFSLVCFAADCRICWSRFRSSSLVLSMC